MNSFLRSAYSFQLPENLIAHAPLLKRDDSRLMVVNRNTKEVTHRHFSDLPEILESDPKNNYSLVVNNTQVFKARLLGERVATGGKVEFFLLKQLAPNQWQGLMKTGTRVLPGFEFIVKKEKLTIQARVLAREETNAGVFFTASFSDDPVAADFGEVPLPPYIEARRRQLELSVGHKSENELTVYNTVFAEKKGSVAAPTAGRHFTPELIKSLINQGIPWHEITLHVGIGTFKPVTVDDLREHRLHEEWCEISKITTEKLNQEKAQGRKILSVGTTTTRALEGAFHLNSQKLESISDEVNLFLFPGGERKFQFVDAMITNFHLPESTLLMMVAAFLEAIPEVRPCDGREWALALYQEAIEKQYRFYSYGDAMLIL